MNRIELSKDALTKGATIKLTTGEGCQGHMVRLLMVGETLFVSEEACGNEADRIAKMDKAYLGLSKSRSMEDYFEVDEHVLGWGELSVFERDLVDAKLNAYFPATLRNMATEAQRKWVLGDA